MRLCTVVRDSSRRRASSAVEQRAFSRSRASRRSSEAVIFMMTVSFVGLPTSYFYFAGPQLQCDDTAPLRWKDTALHLPGVTRTAWADAATCRQRPRHGPNRRPAMSVLAPLAPLRAHAGARLTTGLDDATIERLAASHP